jgi:predicted ester cyclase
MNAGVLKARLRLAAIDKAIDLYGEVVLGGYWKVRGARGGELWIDRQTGDLLSIGFYDDATAVRAFQPIAEQALTRLEPYLEGERPAREIYELVASTTAFTSSLAREFVAALNARDGEAVARLTGSEVELAVPGRPMVKGPQGVKDYYRSLFRAFPDGSTQVERLIGAETSVVLEASFSATHAGPLATVWGEITPTGRRIGARHVLVLEVDRGLIQSIHHYFDQVELLTQMGAAPAQATSA